MFIILIKDLTFYWCSSINNFRPSQSIMITLEEIVSKLKQKCNITITTHQRPDGDAMGSSLALYHFLRAYGDHDVQIISPTEYANYFKWMPGEEKIWEYLPNKVAADAFIESSDLIFCLDFNTLNRIEPVSTSVQKSNAPKILIDHHREPDTFDFMLSDIKASSTCELVHRFIKSIDKDFELNNDIATCIYTGLITDTGGFRFATSSTTMRVAAEMLDYGVNIEFIQNSLNSFRAIRLRFLGNALLNRMKVMPNLRAAYITIPEEDAMKFKLTTGDTEGLVNMPLGIKGIDIAVLFKETPNEKMIRISFRSKGDVSVEKLAREHFQGGGHKNAAGGRSMDSLEQTTKKFISILQNQK